MSTLYRYLKMCPLSTHDVGLRLHPKDGGDNNYFTRRRTAVVTTLQRAPNLRQRSTSSLPTRPATAPSSPITPCRNHREKSLPPDESPEKSLPEIAVSTLLPSPGTYLRNLQEVPISTTGNNLRFRWLYILLMNPSRLPSCYSPHPVNGRHVGQS